MCACAIFKTGALNVLNYKLFRHAAMSYANAHSQS